MMRLIYLFITYSFFGWILETVLVTLRKKKIVNRGFLNGPFCMIYGITAVIITVSLTAIRNDLFFLFLGSMIYATVTEFVAGKFLEKFYHGRWWDYSKKRWNFDGYVCLSHSLFWGVLGTAVVRWINPLMLRFYEANIAVVMHVTLWVLMLLILLDIVGTTAALTGGKKRPAIYDEPNRRMARVAAILRKKIFEIVERRILRAYPLEAEVPRQKEKSEVFAEGCGFYKLFWLFMAGAFIGDLVETVFCRITMGTWMSRSSVVWGPFSIVWGLGIAIFTALLYQQRNRPDGFLFAAGTLLGGAFEYFCSVFTELVFGTIFWDYSDVPFNLAGRINLLFCFFWGIAAVVWFRIFYGRVSGMIEKVPMRAGKIVTWITLVFMAVNIAVSSLALARYQQRREGVEATIPLQEVLDDFFDDDVMKKIYPKAKNPLPKLAPREAGVK